MLSGVGQTGRVTPIEQISRLIGDAQPAQPARPFVLVGIGGHGGAGKSTLASQLAEVVPGTQLVATDAFWNGASFELDRLRSDVVDVLLAGRTARPEEWNWHAAARRPGRTITPEGVVVIEGVCALHQMFRHDLDVRVWVDAPYGVRLERGLARDGEAARSTWTEVWIPNEEAYVRRDDPVRCAHLVVDGTLPFG
jgi:uridine kinase